MSSGARSRYSCSMRVSMRFLIMFGLGTKRAAVCFVTSATRLLCSMVWEGDVRHGRCEKAANKAGRRTGVIGEQ